MKNVLTIAGSDCSGGAGIQADIKAMSANGVYAMSVITAITAQNTKGVFAIENISLDMIKDQIKAIFDDIKVDAIKIGMLSNKEIINCVFSSLKSFSNLVLDPVMVSKSGFKLLSDDAIDELRKSLKFATIVTPNIPEAEILSNIKISNDEDVLKAAKIIKNLGAKNVLIKGGHRLDEPKDTLLLENDKIVYFNAKKIDTKNTHGTGCTLSSAIASNLAKGFDIIKSVKLAKEYITTAISNSLEIGHGCGPVGHFVDIYKRIQNDI